MALVAIHPSLDEGYNWKTAENVDDPHAPKFDALTERVLVNRNCGHIIFVDNLAAHRWVRDVLVEAGIPADRIAILNAEVAQAAAQLNHPNVAQIYTFGQEKGLPYIAMEFVAGQKFDKVIEASKTGLDQAFVLRVGLEIAEGLQAADEIGPPAAGDAVRARTAVEAVVRGRADEVVRIRTGGHQVEAEHPQALDGRDRPRHHRRGRSLQPGPVDDVDLDVGRAGEAD